jgi:hypothetical protein
MQRRPEVPQCASGTCSKFYLDSDADKYPVSSNSLGWCNVSTSQAAGYIPARSDGKWDCCDTDASVSPAQTSYFETASAACGTWDWNCSGTVEKLLVPGEVEICVLDPPNTCVPTVTDQVVDAECGSVYQLFQGCVVITIPVLNSAPAYTCAPAASRQGGPTPCH